MKIVIANHKGGVGKSTISTNLAVQYSKTYNTLLIDTDTSKVSTKFMVRRAEAEIKEETLSIASPSNIDDLEYLMKSNHEIVIVDVGGFNDDMSTTALIYSDLIIIPTDISYADLDGLETIITGIKTILDSGYKLNVCFLPSKIHHSTGEPTIVAGFKDINVLDFPILSPVYFYKVFNIAHGAGMSVCEISPDSKASACIKKVLNDIEELVIHKGK